MVGQEGATGRGDDERLRVLIADEAAERLVEVTEAIQSLGHDVVARVVDVEQVGAVTRAERPDVAFVRLGESSEHALDLISKIVHEAACPVIVLIDVEDAAFIRQAATRGVFAYITAGEAQELQSSIDIVLQRFAEFQNLEGAFGRRAMIERAKGILMALHHVDDREAFELLRAHSQSSGRKVTDVAEAVVESHKLLSPRSAEAPIQPAPERATLDPKP